MWSAHTAARDALRAPWSAGGMANTMLINLICARGLDVYGMLELGGVLPRLLFDTCFTFPERILQGNEDPW